VEALSNLAATLLSLNRRKEAEQYWRSVVKKRPGHLEAVEHLVGLLCGEHRGKEAVDIINYVETSLRRVDLLDQRNLSVSSDASSATTDMKFDYGDSDTEFIFRVKRHTVARTAPCPRPNPFTVPGSDNGRMLALIHAKGNMLYTLGDNVGAAKAFEDAVVLAAGIQSGGIQTLINKILVILKVATDGVNTLGIIPGPPKGPVLLAPEKAVLTAKLVFSPNGQLPGLAEVPSGVPEKAAISTTSNSLLSLAKIFQDGMSLGGGPGGRFGASVKDILALYYLSLSLHPSPSTANNVGILLASMQQTSPVPNVAGTLPHPPGICPGTGVALALAYYNFGLNLDPGHAHLYTNLGSLLKDVNQLSHAIYMYERAVACDGNFDIALANLANAVKDQGRISDAIGYYRRAVKANPEFAEAVCGLANALNSVCDWKGRGGVVREEGNRDRWHVDDTGMLMDAKAVGAVSHGWMKRVVEIVERQLEQGEAWGRGALAGDALEHFLKDIERVEEGYWSDSKRQRLRKTVAEWAGQPYEGAKLVRLIERASRRTVWRWYQDRYVTGQEKSLNTYRRPAVPLALTTPSAPTVLPFHTFTCPLSAEQVRLISERNGLRISVSTLRSSWIPPHVYPPPVPPAPYLRVGYVSSDFNNHPLAHLMQSVFGLHDRTRVKAYCYATTASDRSEHRKQIEAESPVFHDAHSWGPDHLVQQIVNDGIHILINLNGFTRGARNEVFAARPAPIQMGFMGFAGTLGAEWCDYLYADTTAVPPEMLRPTRRNVDIDDSIRGLNDCDSPNWVYAENIIFARYTFFCCDHRQSAPDSKQRQLSWDEETKRRWVMRKSIFPDLRDDQVILGNFNQLYKVMSFLYLSLFYS
jgi:tetratricopeptide (TPR) repeat protein